MNFSITLKAQSLANSSKTQQMDFARSHNAHENHKGHKFCVGRVRFGIFWPTDWTSHRSLTLWICLVFKTKFLKPTWDTTCEGKSEMKCAGQMQNKKWNDTVKLSFLNLTQFLKQHETFPPDPVLTFATFAKKIHALVIMPRLISKIEDDGEVFLSIFQLQYIQKKSLTNIEWTSEKSFKMFLPEPGLKKFFKIKVIFRLIDLKI